MGLGTQVRLSRVFSHPSQRLFGVAADHFLSYQDFPPDSGLSRLDTALGKLMAAHPDSMTINTGVAKGYWPKYAGKAALIVESGTFTVDDRVNEIWAEPEDALRLGADALAVAIAVRGPSEGRNVSALAEAVRKAEKLELPVVAHIYPRNYDGAEPFIEFTPDQIAWAIRVGIETGADVIKVGYPGDQAAFVEMVAECPTPIVVAGGPHAKDLTEALSQVRDALDAGARGAVVGRNIWDHRDPVFAGLAYKAVIHDGLDAAAAIAAARAARADRAAG